MLLSSGFGVDYPDFRVLPEVLLSRWAIDHRRAADSPEILAGVGPEARREI